MLSDAFVASACGAQAAEWCAIIDTILLRKRPRWQVDDTIKTKFSVFALGDSPELGAMQLLPIGEVLAARPN